MSVKEKEKSMKSQSGLPEDAVNTIVERLSVFLADIHQLYIKTLAFHWNVEDERFAQLHELFEEGYEELADDLDEIAERIRQLGALAPGSVKKLSETTRLSDTEMTKNGDQMIGTLAKDYEALVKHIREDIATAEKHGDPLTADILVKILGEYEKRAWMLRSHL